MDNFFNNGPNILKLIVRVRIYHILIYIQEKNLDLITGFLRILFWTFIKVKRTIYFSLLRQTSSYFQRCEIFLFCTSARQKNHVRFTGKCMLYSLCRLSPQFSMLFLFKINNSLHISFQSFINMQILTISHIIT